MAYPWRDYDHARVQGLHAVVTKLVLTMARRVLLAVVLVAAVIYTVANGCETPWKDCGKCLLNNFTR